MKYTTMTAISAVDIAQPMTLPANDRTRTLPMIAGTLGQWRARAMQRHRLRNVDDRLLIDMGLTRADADRESRKPFWRA